MANRLDIRIDLPNDAEIKRMFDAIPKLEHYDVLPKAVRAGARPLVKRARLLTPRSSQANRDKRSNKQKDKADWQTRLYTTIGYVIRKPRRGASYAVVGPRWPKGQKAYFNTSPKGNAGWLWGKPGKSYMRKTKRMKAAKEYTPAKPQPRKQIRNWIVQAYDETKGQQAAAIKAKLRELMDQMWKRGRNG